jgi:hypothetical protein
MENVMTRTISTSFAICVTVLAVSLVGCTSETKTPGPETAAPPPTVNSHAGQAHPTEGPHHGDLIELGNEEYHAEVLHDKQSVTIYILDGAASNQVPSEATEITINTTHDGRPEQFILAALPDVNDPPGKSSRFVSNDEELAGHIDEHGAEPRLVLTINGKSYRGTIQHDHAGHDH